MHMDFSFAHIQCWRSEGKRLKGVHLPPSPPPQSWGWSCTKLHLSSGEGLCMSTQYPVTCVLCDQEEQDETRTRCPCHHTRVPSEWQRQSSSAASANSTRDRFWYELIRLDKTLSWLFLQLCYLYYLKIQASKNVCPGTSRVVPLSQQYSLRNSSLPPLLQDFHSGKPILYGEKLWLWKTNELDLHCTSGFLAWDVS